MRECLHPECGREFKNKSGRNIHFSNHDDHTEIALELLSDVDSVKYETCSDKVGLSSAFYEKHFGSWNCALELAGVDKNVERNISDESLIDELHRMSDVSVVRYDEMNDSGKYSARLYELRFGSWNEALENAGLDRWDRCGQDNPCWRGGITSTKYICQMCDKKFTGRHDRTNKFCGMECKGKWLSENKSGKNSHNWKGGHEKYRGENWEQIKRTARNRANCICEYPNCDVTKEDLGRHLDVHHIVPYRYYESSEKANKLDNLILLCPEHHKKEESRIWRIESVETVK